MVMVDNYVLDIGWLYCVDRGMEVSHSDDILKVRWIMVLTMPSLCRFRHSLLLLMYLYSTGGGFPVNRGHVLGIIGINLHVQNFDFVIYAYFMGEFQDGI